jgi:hypothetical protein
MNHWRYFIWLCGQAADFILLPPVLICSFLVCLIIAGLCVVQRPVKTGLWKRSYWYAFTQLLLYPGVLVVAALGANTQPLQSAPNTVASFSAGFLSWISLALAAFWVWHMKGLRWLAVSLMILQELMLVGPFLVADMAISGRWL